MQQFLPLIKMVAVEALATRAVRRDFRADLSGIAFFTLAGFVILLAMVFMGVAGYGWLRLEMSQPASAAIMAGVFLVIAAGFCVVGRKLMQRNDHLFKRSSRLETERLVDQVTEFITRDLTDPVRENPKTAVLAAALAGFLAGDKIH